MRQEVVSQNLRLASLSNQTDMPLNKLLDGNQIALTEEDLGLLADMRDYTERIVNAYKEEDSWQKKRILCIRTSSIRNFEAKGETEEVLSKEEAQQIFQSVSSLLKGSMPTQETLKFIQKKCAELCAHGMRNPYHGQRNAFGLPL